MSLKEKFGNLTPLQKKIFVWSLIGAVGLLAVTMGYKSRRGQENDAWVIKKEETRDISLEPNLLQKTMLREQRQEIDALKEQLARLIKEDRKEEKKVLPGGPPPAPPAEAKATTLPDIPSAEQLAQNMREDNFRSRFPLPPNVPPPPTPPHTPKEEKVIGGIGILSNRSASPQPAEAKEQGNKKKAERTVYLPPSFMEAMLLTGFDASTSGEGKNNPEPLLLRIQAPAVLPNDVKANLRGCFIIAEAVGKLNKERADVRLASLSCIGRKGQAVIDSPIKGFITDSDSKVGLSGQVVSRMGAATARAVVAGIFAGAGNALQASTLTQTTSPLGSTSIVDSSQLVKSAAGGGLAEGSKTLHDLYLDLARQATPVIEVMSAKKVTVIISEGKELAINHFGNEPL